MGGSWERSQPDRPPAGPGPVHCKTPPSRPERDPTRQAMATAPAPYPTILSLNRIVNAPRGRRGVRVRVGLRAWVADVVTGTSDSRRRTAGTRIGRCGDPTGRVLGPDLRSTPSRVGEPSRCLSATAHRRRPPWTSSSTSQCQGSAANRWRAGVDQLAETGCQRPSSCPRVWPSAVFAGGHRKSSRLGVTSGGAVCESVAVAAGGYDVGVVAEAVEERDGGGLVGQEPSPGLEG